MMVAVLFSALAFLAAITALCIGIAVSVAHSRFLARTARAYHEMMDALQTPLLEGAWCVIANAGGGNWATETPEWQAAAARWRNDYHKWLAEYRSTAGAE